MQGDERRPRRGGHRPIAIKVYLVLQSINVARDGEQNSRIIAARLTRSAAQEIVDNTTGTWVEKYIAVK